MLTYPSDLQAGIATELTALLDRQNRDAFVIFQPQDGPFLQFAGSANESLILDLPKRQLGAALAAAELFFERLPESVIQGPHSLMVRFGQDAERAAQVAFRLFDEVIQLAPGTEVAVDAN